MRLAPPLPGGAQVGGAGHTLVDQYPSQRLLELAMVISHEESACQFIYAQLDLRVIETCAVRRIKLQGALVMLGSQLALAKMIQTDRKIEGEFRIAGFQRIGIEIGLLRLAPARLPGVEIAQPKK